MQEQFFKQMWPVTLLAVVLMFIPNWPIKIPVAILLIFIRASYCLFAYYQNETD
ncbi:MAG: hypothetical protein ACK5MW_06645 [Enterococcus sp.]